MESSEFSIKCSIPDTSDISSNENPFARNLYGAFVKAIFWFIGEVEDKKWINNEEDGDEKINTALKTEDVLGKFILLVFIFLFVIVLMNLLNAIAIGDIQVCSFLYAITMISAELDN